MQYIFLPNFPEDKRLLTNIPFLKKAKPQWRGSAKNLRWKATAQSVEVEVPTGEKKMSNHVWVLKVQQQ